MLKNWTGHHQSGETGRRERVAKWCAEAMPGGMFVHPPGAFFFCYGGERERQKEDIGLNFQKFVEFLRHIYG
jgi:predicted esterase